MNLSQDLINQEGKLELQDEEDNSHSNEDNESEEEKEGVLDFDNDETKKNINDVEDFGLGMTKSNLLKSKTHNPKK